MAIDPNAPPSISPAQMNLLRTVATMAWSDGDLAEEEIRVMLDQFSRLFAQDPSHQANLRAELENYLTQNIPLDELVPKLTSTAQRQVVLKLGYQVISASARNSEEELINQEEAAAYHRLVELLALPEEVVQQIEQDCKEMGQATDNLVDHITSTLQQFMQTS
ncbi:MAG: TerB family tellurite resistance protein [Cyanobacteriota bacterium]|nr:TerB family tellurite resistance protein [Cyanobacteriota bacterium]